MSLIVIYRNVLGGFGATVDPQVIPAASSNQNDQVAAQHEGNGSSTSSDSAEHTAVIILGTP